MNQANTIDKYLKIPKHDSLRFDDLVRTIDFLLPEQKSYLIQHLLEAELFTVVLNQTHLINIDTPVEDLYEQLSCLTSEKLSKILEAIAILMKTN